MQCTVCSFFEASFTLIHRALVSPSNRLILKVKNQVLIRAKGPIFMEDH